MPSSSSSSSSLSSSSSSSSSTTNPMGTDPNEGINKEACEKYGITIDDLPTEPVEPYSRYSSDDTVFGFITEVTHDQKGTEVEIKDWGYCLEENRIPLGFQNMLRSEIMEEVIKTYGLVPIVDFTDLKNDVITWDNSTAKSSDGGDLTTGAGSGSQSIDAAVDEAIRGITDPLQKAKAIDSAFKNHVYYSGYWNCEYPNDLEKAWQDAHLNCADGANILCAMFMRGGFSSSIVHVDAGDGHYIVRVNVNGTDYYTDNAASDGAHTTRPFGEVYGGSTSGSDRGTHLDY